MYRIKIDSNWKKIADEFSVLADEKTWDMLMRESAQLMLREAKRLCPVDTGVLRDSIFANKVGTLWYEIASEIHYADKNEYGWYAIPIGDEQNPVFYKGGYRPYLRPAVWGVLDAMPTTLSQYFTILR